MRCKIDGDEVQRLAEGLASAEEIAMALGTSVSVLEVRFKGRIRKGYGVALAKVRAEQLKVALEGNVPMLLWLGKNYLRQGDDDGKRGKPAEKRAPAGRPLGAGAGLRAARRLGVVELERLRRATESGPEESDA